MECNSCSSTELMNFNINRKWESIAECNSCSSTELMNFNTVTSSVVVKPLC